MLVKWWLLAISHYLVVGIFTGTGTGTGTGWVRLAGEERELTFVADGLIGLLVLVAVVTWR